MKLIDLLHNLEIDADAFYKDVKKQIKDSPEKYENYSIEKDFKDALLSQNVRKTVYGNEDRRLDSFVVDFRPITIFIYDGRPILAKFPWIKPEWPSWYVFPTEDRGDYILNSWFFYKMISGDKIVFTEGVDRIRERLKNKSNKSLEDFLNSISQFYEEDEYGRNV